jgi:hypothetical protein
MRTTLSDLRRGSACCWLPQPAAVPLHKWKTKQLRKKNCASAYTTRSPLALPHGRRELVSKCTCPYFHGASIPACNIRWTSDDIRFANLVFNWPNPWDSNSRHVVAGGELASACWNLMSQQRVANTVDDFPASSDSNGASAPGCSDPGCRSTMNTCKGVSVACPCRRGDPPSLRRVEEANSLETNYCAAGVSIYRTHMHLFESAVSAVGWQ